MDMSLLGIHSHFSLLNGVPKIKKMVADAKKKGYTRIALTDNGNLYGAIEFYKACKTEGIKPVIGVSVYLDPSATCHPRLILIAKNNIGYTNLLYIVSDSNLAPAPSSRPVVRKDTLRAHTEGLAAVIPPINSEWAVSLGTRNKSISDEYRTLFGENLYLGVTDQSIPEWNDTKEALCALAKKHAIPQVVSRAVYYLSPEDREARSTLLKVQYSRRPDLEQEVFSSTDLSLPSAEDTERAFQSMPEVIENTNHLMESCQVEINLGSWRFPDIAVKNTPEETLKDLVDTGLQKRVPEITNEVRERVEMELGVIISKKYAKYFLVVREIVNYMNDRKIPTSTRGSAAGCLVSFALGITDINPITYRIPFERFLNPFRPSPPDIDVDIADDKRDDVIQFITDRFGSDNVAQIGTFGTMLARAAVRDTARALGYPYTAGDRIARMVPLGKQGMPMTIDKALTLIPELKELYDTNEDAKKNH